MGRHALAGVIGVDKELCKNCHACIAALVKYCNDGSGDHITINQDMCIGCGSCLSACTHGARYSIDDFPAFMTAARAGTRMVAVVAPAAAASFAGGLLRLNGWLHSLGVEAFFDVSFGAELTVRSYLEHVRRNNPPLVIAQPCPAIVTYIQVYKPELLPYLAPADSPMLHTIKMVREFYPQYSAHKVVVISPCIAKKREFQETGAGDYNVTFVSLEKHLKDHTLDLGSFPEVGFQSPQPERAVLFSTPGGLLQTAERWMPSIREVTRKIEGPESHLRVPRPASARPRARRRPEDRRLPQLRLRVQRRNRRLDAARAAGRAGARGAGAQPPGAGALPGEEGRPAKDRKDHRAVLEGGPVRQDLPRPQGKQHVPLPEPDRAENGLRVHAQVHGRRHLQLQLLWIQEVRSHGGGHLQRDEQARKLPPLFQRQPPGAGNPARGNRGGEGKERPGRGGKDAKGRGGQVPGERAQGADDLGSPRTHGTGQ